MYQSFFLSVQVQKVWRYTSYTKIWCIVMIHELLISLFLSCWSQKRRKCRITRKVIKIRPLSLNCVNKNSWYVAVYESSGSLDATCAPENLEEIHPMWEIPLNELEHESFDPLGKVTEDGVLKMKIFSDSNGVET